MTIQRSPYQLMCDSLNGRLFDVEFDPDDFKLEVRYDTYRPSSDLDFSTKPPKLIPRYDRVRLVGILFAAEGAPLAKAQIQPRMAEHHYRSGQNFDLFAAGYDKFWNAKGEFEPQFDAKRFNIFREDVEQKTKWRYSGDVDLILANAKLDQATNHSVLDFDSSIVCQLDKMLKDGAISSVGSFLEKVFQYTDTQPNNDPAWGLSDHLGLTFGKSALVGLISKLLPKGVSQTLKAGQHLAVRSLAP